MQLSLTVIDSRGVSLMPQLKTTKPAGPQSRVPYFTCFKGIVCFELHTFTNWYLPTSSLRDRVLGIRSKQLEISCQTVLFQPKVNQNKEPRSKLLRATDTILIIPFNETIQPVCSLCHCCDRPLLYSLWSNGPPHNCVHTCSACRWHHCCSCTGSLRETYSASLYQ